MTTDNTKFESWALVEIMGHQRLAGLVSEQVIAGSAMLRVDVPATSSVAEFTTFLGSGSIYRLTPVTEDIARRYAEGIQVKPVSEYQLPALAAPTAADDDDTDYRD